MKLLEDASKQILVFADEEMQDVLLDLQAELVRLGLGELLEDRKPDGEATDKLYSKAEKLKKLKAIPFVNAKQSFRYLRKFPL